MRILSLVVLAASAALLAQNSSPTRSSTSKQSAPTSDASRPVRQSRPIAQPPRSDSVNIKDLGTEDGESSSKDTQVDLSPPPDDDKAHPNSPDVLNDEGSSSEHPWDPHKAAKDIEVGDFYFKRKNYRAAEDRYREALYYKDNDALATYHLAICLEKQDRPEEARAEYENYLKILPYGPDAENAKKAIDRLKAASSAKAAK